MISTFKHLAYFLKCNTTASELSQICTELTDPAFIYDSKYYRRKVEIKIKNGKIKERILYPSKGRLKVIQKKIKSKILSKISLPEYIHGGAKGKSNITNARAHKGKRFKFTTDLSKFFPSVKPQMVYKMFCDYGFSFDVSRALTILCTYKGMLPQGAPTSTHIANLVFLPVDIEINQSLSAGSISYTRYVDDITFSSDADFKSYVGEFLRIITQFDFRISHQKTFYKGKSDITGIDVGYNKLQANKKFLDKLSDTSQTEDQKIGRLRYLSRIEQANKK